MPPGPGLAWTPSLMMAKIEGIWVLLGCVIFAGLFLLVLIYVTVQYVRDLKTGQGSILRKTGRWLRDIFDTLSGLG